MVRDFFKRVEFQQRGSAHVHTVLWLENAHVDEELSGADGAMPHTLEMVRTLLTLDTDLLRRPRTQCHAHTHTCYKRGRTQCRFGAPVMPSDETRIMVPFPPLTAVDESGALAPHEEAERLRRQQLKAKYNEMHQGLEHGDFDSLEQFLRVFDVGSREQYLDILRAGATRPHVLHERTPAQKRVNAFNSWIGRVLDSNMDLQLILDHYACASYVIDYVNKSDHGMSHLQRAVADLLKDNANEEYRELLRKLQVNVLKGVEMSAQEAAWFLLRQEMSRKSRDVLYIPTCFPEESVRVRKTNEEVNRLPAGSTDVWKPNVIQKYEARWPPELDNVCLADFVSKYKERRQRTTTTVTTTTTTSGSGSGDDDAEDQVDADCDRPTKTKTVTKTKANTTTLYSLRERPVVIRYRNYNPGEDVDSYMREQVLLYVPFRSEAVDVLDGNKYVRLYEEHAEAIELKRREYNPANDDVVVTELVHQHYAEMLRLRQEEELRRRAQEEEEAEYGDNDEVSAAERLRRDHEAAAADLVPSQQLLRLVKEVSTPCAAVRRRKDILDRKSYETMMRMTNLEQYELLREILHRQTLPPGTGEPLRVFLTGPAGCGKTFVLKLAMDAYNRCNAGSLDQGSTSELATTPSVSMRRPGPSCNPYNAYVVCASTGKAAVAVGGTTVHAASPEMLCV